MSLPGRLEVVGRDPWVIIDAAHTRESVRALATFVAGVETRARHFVLSVSIDKALEPMLELLLPLAGELTLTCADPVRGLAPAEIARRIGSRATEIEVHLADDPGQAIREARASLAPDALLCVVGSVYLAGIARRELVAP